MVTIIGAGPAGSYSAYLLSKKGLDVGVYEEHKEIGLPIQCTGIVTSLLKKTIRLDKGSILNEVDKARIFSPNNRFVEVKLKEKNIILDRHRFDNQIADMAKDNGARFFTDHRFIENKKDVAFIKDKAEDKIKKVSFDHLIGADGPLSAVARCNGMFGQRKFWQGIQARVKIKNENIVEFYPYFGTYAWMVPEDEETMRIGLVDKRYANVLFKNFLFKFKKINKKNIIEYQAGLIPKYNPSIKAQKDTIYIVGDAASQVKATTGGGIIQGLTASKALSSSITDNKDYDKEFRKVLGRELYIHLKARNIMDRFKSKDWNKLIDIFSSESGKKILESNERDNLAEMALKLLIKKPSLLCFMKYLI